MIMTTLILLAAGRGSRLKSLTEDIPKCLNTYQGKPLIQHTLDLASKFRKQITKIVIISGYRGELLTRFGYEVLENSEWSFSGPFRSLAIAHQFLESSSCIVSYTDIVYGEEFLQSCLSSRADIFIPSNANYSESWNGRRVDIYEDLETFAFVGNRLIEIGNRPKTHDEIQGQFAGILKTTPEGWRDLYEVAQCVDSQHLDITGLLSLAIKEGVNVECEQVRSPWKEFDLPSDFN
jgi:choline kinase